MLKKGIFLSFFLVFLLNANDFSKKIIIKLEEPEEVELIDLGQRILDENEEALFDSSLEREKNNLFLKYEDSDKDFVILSSFNKDFRLNLKESELSAEDLAFEIFENMVSKIQLDKSIELLNKQNNALYQLELNFENLTKTHTNHIFFDMSNTLHYETNFYKIYTKVPEYLLFIMLESLELEQEKKWTFTTNFVHINIPYKIVDLEKNAIIKNEILTFSIKFDEKANKKEYEDIIIEELSSFLKEYFSQLAQSL